MLTIPKDGDLYVSSVVERCRHLIDAAIWGGLSQLRLDEWLSNFVSPAERYFAACVLDALVYRSAPQTQALATQLFQRVIPDLIRQQPCPVGGSVDWLDLLRQTSDLGVRIVPVIRDLDPPTKSGPFLCRALKRWFQLNERWMIWPWQIEDAVQRGVRTFLFVDDFLGTGTQFGRFAKRFEIQERLRDAYGAYCPLVAHETGIQYLRESFAELKFCAVEKLGSEHGLFHPAAPWFADGENTPEDALGFYQDLISRRKIDVPENYVIGFGGLGLAYAFEHAMPNNSIPLLWYRSTQWLPLLDR